MANTSYSYLFKQTNHICNGNCKQTNIFEYCSVTLRAPRICRLLHVPRLYGLNDFFSFVITLEFHPQECHLGCVHECVYVYV